MKLKAVVLGLIMIFSTTAHAAISYCKNGTCQEFTEVHISGIKGLLYESTTHFTAKEKERYIAPMARAISWLERIHKDKKKYKLEKLTSDEAKIIIATVNLIIQVVSREIDVPDEYLKRWTRIGKRVIAVKTTSKDKKNQWKILLKKAK